MRNRRKRFRPSLWIILFLFIVFVGVVFLFSGKELPMQKRETPKIETDQDESFNLLKEAKDDLNNSISVWTDLFNVIVRGEESKYENGYEALAGRGVEKDTSKGTQNQENSLLTEASLVRVVDGDTIVVSIDDETYKVRLIGIDTPESVHADESKNTVWGTYASDHTKELLDGIETVYLEYDEDPEDQYGRTLAYVWLTPTTDDISQMLNYRILADGYAKAKVYMPNDRYADVFSEIESSAIENQTGLWGEGLKNQ